MAAVSGFLAVALGAVVGHDAGGRLGEEGQRLFAIGLRYQMFHVAALLAVALLSARRPAKSRAWGLELAGWAFLAGTVLFSGVLYLMALGVPRWLVWLVPLGGLCYLAGWLGLLWHALRGGRADERDDPGHQGP